MSNKSKPDSPLVQAVLALDNHLGDLERIGAKINSTDMTSEIDIDYIQKLINRFAECGKGISQELANLAARLEEARTRAEAVAQGVSQQAQRFNQRRAEHDEKLESFRLLGEKVRELTAVTSQFRLPDGQDLTNEDRAKLASNISAFEGQLALLVQELKDFQKSARDSRMRVLEKKAESLAQSLDAIRKRLRGN